MHNTVFMSGSGDDVAHMQGGLQLSVLR